MVVGIPVTAMAVVLDERMMVMVGVKPAFVVMIVVGEAFAGAGDHEGGDKGEEEE